MFFLSFFLFFLLSFFSFFFLFLSFFLSLSWKPWLINVMHSLLDNVLILLIYKYRYLQCLCNMLFPTESFSLSGRGHHSENVPRDERWEFFLKPQSLWDFHEILPFLFRNIYSGVVSHSVFENPQSVLYIIVY